MISGESVETEAPAVASVASGHPYPAGAVALGAAAESAAAGLRAA
jgi:hypothetical protein